jgi:hypothetical protein
LNVESARVSTPRFFFWLPPLFDHPRFAALENEVAHSAPVQIAPANR